MAGLRGRGILTKNGAGKGGGAGDGSDYILQLRISVLEQVVMHSYHIDGERSLAGWSLFSLNFEVSWPFQGPRRPFCKRQYQSNNEACYNSESNPSIPLDRSAQWNDKLTEVDGKEEMLQRNNNKKNAKLCPTEKRRRSEVTKKLFLKRHVKDRHVFLPLSSD